ncbi:MAG: S1C family serine protease [Candidatus Sulfotelmatobacter sp.]
MPEFTNVLHALSEQSAELVERARPYVVAVHGGGRSSASGIHWRPGIIVTAEESLERDEGIKLTLPDNSIVDASLVGRDPTTDVAVLRFESNGFAAASPVAAPLRPGHLVWAIGNRHGSALAAVGTVALVGGPWRSLRGGTIANLIRLDLRLSPAAEGGALVDVQGQVLGMTVLGPRRRALAIPTATVDKAVEQLLKRGHVVRGYLGAGLQPLQRHASRAAANGHGSQGLLVASIDPDGPAARAGLLVGDILNGWNGEPVNRVRDVMARLGHEEVGKSIELSLTRGGAAAALKVVIGERPVR